MVKGQDWKLTGPSIVATLDIKVSLGGTLFTLFGVWLPFWPKGVRVGRDTSAERVAKKNLRRRTSRVVRGVPHLQQSAVEVFGPDVA